MKKEFKHKCTYYVAFNFLFTLIQLALVFPSDEALREYKKYLRAYKKELRSERRKPKRIKRRPVRKWKKWYVQEWPYNFDEPKPEDEHTMNDLVVEAPPEVTWLHDLLFCSRFGIKVKGSRATPWKIDVHPFLKIRRFRKDREVLDRARDYFGDGVVRIRRGKAIYVLDSVDVLANKFLVFMFNYPPPRLRHRKAFLRFAYVVLAIYYGIDNSYKNMSNIIRISFVAGLRRPNRRNRKKRARLRRVLVRVRHARRVSNGPYFGVSFK